MYRPASGTEGLDFTSKWCGRCKADRNEDCPILAASFIREVEQWRYERGEPVCTDFDARDPLDVPYMASAAIADMFPRRSPTQGEQIRMLVRSSVGTRQ